MAKVLEDASSCVHSNHTQLQMARQRVCRIAAGYEHAMTQIFRVEVSESGHVMDFGTACKFAKVA